MVRTQCFHCRGRGSIPGQGTKNSANYMVQLEKEKKVLVLKSP